MKYLIILACLFTSNFLAVTPVTLAAVANIDHIVFTTEAQTLAPDTISKVLTIQTQNASGVLETIDETADLYITINSLTGQFNSNSTTWNPTDTFTMSKNTSNKNFYYKDSTLGTYTIQATLTTRTTGKSWSTSQNITISNEIVIPNTSGEVLGTSTSAVATTTTIVTNTIISTHYITETLTTYVEPTVFELSAGRERLGYVGIPLSFIAKSKMSSDVKSKNCKYLWSFGDGSSLSGKEAEHVYKYVGEYNLVLNGECGETKSVSRTTVHIYQPNLEYSLNLEGELTIKNNGTTEINLYGLKSPLLAKNYSFPLDTILSAKSQITLARELTFLNF